MTDLLGRRWLGHAVLLAATALTVADLVVWRAQSGTPAVVVRLAPGLLLATGVLLARRRHRDGGAPIDRRLALACCALVLALAAVGPVRGSRDLWAYAMYGRVASVHHADPYVTPPAAFPRDPFLARMNPIWRETRSVYGPAFDEYAAIVTRVAGDSPDATRLLFKGTAAACVLGLVVLLDRRRVDPAAIALVAMHPATVLYGVAGGHNDAMVGLAALAGVLLLERRRVAWAGVALALACLVKVAVGLVVAGALVWLWHRPDPRGRRDAVVLAGTAGGLVAGGYLLAGGATALRPLSAASHMVSWTSFWRPVGRWLGLGGHTSTVALVVVLAVVGFLVLRHRHDHTPEVLVASLLLVYLAGSAYTLVWYLVWALPVAALRWRSRTATLVGLLATLYLLPRTLRFGLQLGAVGILVSLVLSAGQSTKTSSTVPAQAQ